MRGLHSSLFLPCFEGIVEPWFVNDRSNIKICGGSACGSDRKRSPLCVSDLDCLLFVVVVVVREMFLFGSYLGAGICATGQYALSS